MYTEITRQLSIMFLSVLVRKIYTYSQTLPAAEYKKV